MNLNITKKIAAIGLAAMLSGCMLGNPETLNAISDSFAITASAATASGKCGANLNWSLSGDTITITGSGAMYNYSSSGSNQAPWKSYASTVKKVIFPKGLTTIGNYAFYNMSALEYVYTKNGINAPCFPDVTTIGDYAFANCYAFRGNTSNGAMTLGLGTDNIMASGTLLVKDSAFQNCDQVRFLNCNYKTLKVEQWGFYSMDMLSSLNLSNTKVELGKRAFYYSRNLANVNVLPSALTIHDTAFDYTSYKTNKCTTTPPPSLNVGAATKLTGKQLVVNFFVDRTIVDLKNTYGSGRVRTLGTWEEYSPKSGEIVCPFYEYYSNYLQTTGVYKKSSMTAFYAYGWNPQKRSNQSSPSSNSVITLNKVNFANQSDPLRIPLNTVQNGTTSGFFGSYVESADITERLNDVRDAMNDLKAQAAEYGANFTYEMHPETNFHITYDYFDWSTKPKYGYGPDGEYLGYDYTVAYGGNNPEIEMPRGVTSTGLTHVSGSAGDKLFSSILSASRNLTGTKKQTIDLNRNGSDTSPYTQYLKNKYNVSSVIYLIHFNTISQAETRHSDMDEFSIICEMPQNSDVAEITAHESAHLFGAKDYYYTTGTMNPKQQYAANYFDYELMKSRGTKVSPVTAFYLGWRTWLDTPTWNTFFG